MKNRIFSPSFVDDWEPQEAEPNPAGERQDLQGHVISPQDTHSLAH